MTTPVLCGVCTLFSHCLLVTTHRDQPLQSFPIVSVSQMSIWNSEKMANSNTRNCCPLNSGMDKRDRWMDTALSVLEAQPKGNLRQRSLHWAISSRKHFQRNNDPFWLLLKQFPRETRQQLEILRRSV